MATQCPIHAWYSKKAHELCGASVYLDVNGKEVLCTIISESKDFSDKYLWDDKVYVGLVYSHVRTEPVRLVTRYEKKTNIIHIRYNNTTHQISIWRHWKSKRKAKSHERR